MNLGWPEIMLVLVVALIVFGPRKLPEIGKTLGQSLAQFRKASEEFKRTWEDEVESERRRPVQPAHQIESTAPEAPPDVSHSIMAPTAEPEHVSPTAPIEDLGSQVPGTVAIGDQVSQAAVEASIAQPAVKEVRRDWM